MAVPLAIWLRLSPVSSYTNLSTSAFKVDIPLFHILPHHLNLVAASPKFLPGDACRIRLVQMEEIIRHNLRAEISDPCLSLELSLKSARTCGCLATS